MHGDLHRSLLPDVRFTSADRYQVLVNLMPCDSRTCGLCGCQHDVQLEK